MTIHRALVRTIVAAGAAASLLAAAVPANADTVGLDGGGGCYGLGESAIPTRSLALARTTGCTSSVRYVSAGFAFGEGGESYCPGAWYAYDPVCSETSAYVYHMIGSHNLAFEFANGYESTSAWLI